MRGDEKPRVSHYYTELTWFLSLRHLVLTIDQSWHVKLGFQIAVVIFRIVPTSHHSSWRAYKMYF